MNWFTKEPEEHQHQKKEGCVKCLAESREIEVLLTAMGAIGSAILSECTLNVLVGVM